MNVLFFHKLFKHHFFWGIIFLLLCFIFYNSFYYRCVKYQYIDTLLKKLEYQYYASVAQRFDQLHQNYLKEQEIKNLQITKPLKRIMYQKKQQSKKAQYKCAAREFVTRPIGYAQNSLFSWPIEKSNFWLSSRFGPRRKDDRSWGYHYGIDMAAARGTPVIACASGEVIEANFSTRGYGKTIVLRHKTEQDIYETRYAHLDKIFVYVGQRVVKGYCIGVVGDTGFVRGENGGRNAYHLHFEVKKSGKHIDPLYVLA